MPTANRRDHIRMASADALASRPGPGFSGSDNTYHSFYDIELFPPASPPKDQPQRQENHVVSTRQSRHDSQKENEHPSSTEMKRQDSGYESLTRTSTSSSLSSTSKSRTSHATATTTRSNPPTPHSRSRPVSSRGRPVARRSPKSTSAYSVRPAATTATTNNTNNNPFFPLQHLHITTHDQTQSSYIHFPAHPTDLALANTNAKQPHPRPDTPTRTASSPALRRPPPQPTTHYWTSDRTRRLEYAAIDAAHRGVKGWARRHLVPDCFLPKEKARVAFDDDSGSVRRYRLDLSSDDDDDSRDGAVSPVSLRPMNGEGDGEKKEERQAKRPRLSFWGRMRTW
ncbi:hypothetical protein ACRALDRAFT_2050419 [Sodiomyces alcalophilus JCM 7366]|uniref:uncharacterized protein n=1 Tax=Sodiomyces alcalophilus JCM 7366 TaxID=591952 RepID=UPI0039B6642B